MKKAIIALSFVLASGFVLAHGDMKPMHNGVLAEASSGSVAELSTEGNMLMVYLADHEGKALAAKGASAELTILNGSEKQTIKLSPSGDNSLMAMGAFKTPAGAKALLKVTFPGKAVDQFRFVLK